MFKTVLTKLFVIQFLFFSIMSCESQKKTYGEDFISGVVIEKSNRGQSSMLTVNKDNFALESMTLGSAPVFSVDNKRSADQWKELNAIISKLDLSKFESLGSPTEERLFDGAATTVIRLQKSDGTELNSEPFDEGRPPAELQELYDYLENVVNQ